MNSTQLSFRNRLTITGLVIAIIATIAGGVYLFLMKYPEIALRTNRTQTVLTTKKYMMPFLWEGAQIYFFNKYMHSWHKGLEPTLEEKKEQRKILKYKPHIEHIIDADPTMQVNHNRPTIFLHGWGDTKNSAKLLKAFGDVLPGNLITFNFRDHGVLIPKLRQSNLGQEQDVLSALFTIKWVKDKLKVNEVDLFGYSRGGATLLNLIAVLNDKKGMYDELLARIDIDAQERQALLDMIQRGCHVLNCPLTDLNMSVEARMKSAKWIDLFEAFTKYKRDGLQGITSAQQFAGLNLNMLLHFQYRDTVISNNNEAELYRRLAQHNPQTTFVTLGNNGGHLHTHATLAHTVHYFKKMFGSSYDPAYVTQYQATKNQQKTSHLLLRPGASIDRTLDSYYQDCVSQENAGKKG